MQKTSQIKVENLGRERYFGSVDLQEMLVLNRCIPTLILLLKNGLTL